MRPLPDLLQAAAFAARRPAHVVLLADRGDARRASPALPATSVPPGGSEPQARGAIPIRTGRPRSSTGSGT